MSDDRGSSTKIVDPAMKPSQCRAARAMVELSQTDLARAAGLGLSTVVDFEKDRRQVSAEAVQAMRNALEAAGVEFTNGMRRGCG
jgi:DNA-binding transcriptional regulator YiaG